MPAGSKRCSVEKVFWKISQNLQEKLEACNFTEKETPPQVISFKTKAF